MHYLVTEDFDAGYEKIFLELQAIGWNSPEVRRRVASVFTEWYEILMPAFDTGLDELGVDKTVFPTVAVVSLVMTFNLDIEVERLSGFDSGHAALFHMIDTAIESAHEQQRQEAADEST